MDTKQFPNGFASWQETHYEIVEHLTLTLDKEGSMAERVHNNMGIGGLYELAEDLTDEFEELNNGREWDGEFFDEIELFLNKKEQIKN